MYIFHCFCYLKKAHLAHSWLGLSLSLLFGNAARNVNQTVRISMGYRLLAVNQWSSAWVNWHRPWQGLGSLKPEHCARQYFSFPNCTLPMLSLETATWRNTSLCFYWVRKFCVNKERNFKSSSWLQKLNTSWDLSSLLALVHSSCWSHWPVIPEVPGKERAMGQHPTASMWDIFPLYERLKACWHRLLGQDSAQGLVSLSRAVCMSPFADWSRL